jgi:hypothetical protein
MVNRSKISQLLEGEVALHFGYLRMLSEFSHDGHCCPAVYGLQQTAKLAKLRGGLIG